jgi:DNA-binding transcriptional ArsR family regulator
MPVKQKKSRPAAPSVAAIVAHPLRARCWIALSERVASPNELKTEFDASIGDVSYHVSVLERLGHVELVDTKPRRGAIEHYYRAVDRPALDDEEWATLTLEQRSHFAERLVQLSFADAAVAFDHKTFARRTNHHVLRMPATVDEEGFAEMAALYTELIERQNAIAAASANRMAADPDAGSIPISSIAMFFEMPEPKRRTDRKPSS